MEKWRGQIETSVQDQEGDKRGGLVGVLLCLLDLLHPFLEEPGDPDRYLILLPRSQIVHDLDVMEGAHSRQDRGEPQRDFIAHISLLFEPKFRK